MKRALVKLREFPNACYRACPHCQGPQRAARPQARLLPRSLLLEAVNIVVRGAGKEKQLVEIALPEQFRIALRKAGVFRELARRKAAQRHHLDSRLFSKRVQQLRRRGVRLGHGDTREASQTHRPRRFQVEIAFWKIDAASTFRDKWMPQAKLAQRGVESQPVLAGHRHQRDICLHQSIQKIGKACECLVVRADQIVDCAKHYGGGRPQRIHSWDAATMVMDVLPRWVTRNWRSRHLAFPTRRVCQPKGMALHYWCRSY